ncbi:MULTISPECIES: hypothetical protein [unclassified Mucilaginibacter]|uniref:hypothetical protein n=1 Tax=unclassified Mucilaginibacter TaxID=2617802 RepID=UPI0009684EB7|nr:MULTISPECIES: hypothetical protein [unclassified Mucilaginibacter]HEK21018.1 hypothetical protein [Bacteroidota bacterium]OJW18314.1 MAG: hypothetical protein BGO48_17340 [Mucilaginibacter sp. 44-25]PAW94048.1 hypothetical protein CKK33_11300 [Mucilaginibacter sp. MD40]PLW88470.1 MAG: hypothetical protein C0154_16210 [Mucilaginibacter sp.]PMP66175.1 MAG: hypothetical protein C0191_01180 [Mucilaginibacter sp.]
MYHPFSVVETVKTSWDIFRKNFVTIIVYSVIAFFLLGILGLLAGFVYSPEDYWASMIVTFILIWLQAYTTLGLYKLIFTVIDSEYYDFEFMQVIPKAKMVWSYLAVVFIFAFVVTNLGIAVDYLDNNPNLQFAIELLAGLGGLYLALRVMFFNTFIVDDNSGPIESIKQSFELTRGYLLKVISILLIIILLIALPAKISQYYPLISITILFTYPFVNIILAVTYRKLIYSHQDIDDNVSETD